MAMSSHDITTPKELTLAWEAGDVSEWDAVVVLLHHIDRENVAAWLTSIPSVVRDAIVAAAQEMLSTDTGGFVVGRGAGLEPRPGAVRAIIEWTFADDGAVRPQFDERAPATAKINPAPPALDPALAAAW